jgi:biotin carboxyl carrier protein
MDLRKLKRRIDLRQESNVSELEITEAEGKVRIVNQWRAIGHAAAGHGNDACTQWWHPCIDVIAASATRVKSPMVGTSTDPPARVPSSRMLKWGSVEGRRQ